MSPRVLVLTTRTAFAEPLSLALRASELDYVGARTLRAALELVQGEELPSAVVVDLPCVSADIAPLCDAVRAREQGGGVPIILCGTGGEAIKSTSDALIAGGDGYFALPCDALRIVAKLATYIGCPVPELQTSLQLPGGDVPAEPATETTPAYDPGALDAATLDAVTTDGAAVREIRAVKPNSEGEERDESDEGAPSARRSVGASSSALEPTIPVPALISGLPRPADAALAVTAEGATVHDVAADAFDRELADHAIAEARADAERSRAERDRAQREQAERDHAERERVQRDEAEREAAARAQAEQEQREREQAERQLERERAEREQAEREQAAQVAREALEAQERASREAHEIAAREQQLALERLRAAAEAEQQRADEERARLQRLEEERRLAEAEAQRALAEAQKRSAEERIRLAALEEQRKQAEVDAERALAEARAREDAERERLQQLEEQRRRAEAEAARVLAEARAREDNERARLQELEEQRKQAESDAERAVAEARAREEGERERLKALEERRKQAELETGAALAEARAREEAERARLLALEERRKQAEADAVRSLAQAHALEQKERRQLEELARTRHEAERALAESLDESARREAEARHALEQTERAREAEAERLRLLQRQREEAERDARSTLGETARLIEEAERSLDDTRRREQAERERLAALEIERSNAEGEAARARAEAATQEAALRAALEDLERHRRALEEESRRKEDENRRRAAEEADRLRVLEEERRRLDEQARVDQEDRRRKARREEDELHAIAERRRRAEDELRTAIAERMSALADEEARLAALRNARENAEQSEREAVLQREREAAEALAKLEEARRLRAEVEREAQEELEALRRMRHEEELARRELEEKRARARLAFQSGRLDAVPAGELVGGVDVGGRPRPVTDAEGNILGAGLLPVVRVDVEPAPPLPFVPLDPPVGRFVDGELAGLLWAAHSLKVTGAVELLAEDGGRTRTLYLEEGEPVLVASSLAADRPEEGLLRAGLITAITYNELRAGPLRSPRRTAAALVSDGLLKTEELFPAVRGVLVEQVLALLEWESGTFAYKEERAHAADRVRLEHRFSALLAEGVRRKLDERRLWNILGGPSTLVGPDDRARDLPPLSPEEKVVLARFDGTRALEDIIVETAIAAPVVLRTALIAVSCGAARVLARGVAADPNSRMLARERSVTIDRARVVDRLQAARHGDYFTFLGVDVHASAFEVQRAAERIRQRFDPARFSDPAFGDLRAALQEIHDVSVDAEAVLGDEALAEGYRRSLGSGTQRPALRRVGDRAG